MAGMGIGVGDYDLDGHLDIVKTHFQLQPAGLYRNLGKGEFEDQAQAAGLAGERQYVSWGTGIFDLDNDGYPDIFWVTGNVYAEIERINPKFPYKGPRACSSATGATAPLPEWETRPALRSMPVTSAVDAPSEILTMTATSTWSS
jgi:hypothetical protein